MVSVTFTGARVVKPRSRLPKFGKCSLTLPLLLITFFMLRGQNDRPNVETSVKDVQDLFHGTIGGCLLCRGQCRQSIGSCPGQESMTAIVYVYFPVQENYPDNLEFFISRGVGYSSTIDYSFVLRGPHHSKIPNLPNVYVYYDESNLGYDVGGWVQGLTWLRRDSGRKYKYFIFMNSSIRGPFLPSYAPSSKVFWVSIFTDEITSNDKLIGISVNCPDGVGRKIPHIQSMIWATDNATLDGLVKERLWRVPKDKSESFKFEGDISLHVFSRRHNIVTLQRKYSGWDFSALLQSTDPCDGIDLDVFFKDNWYNGMTPHPLEYVFFKTNRGVGAEMVQTYSGWPKQEPYKRQNIVAFTHNLNLEGATLYLFDLVSKLKDKYNIKIISPHDGPLRQRYYDQSISVSCCTLNTLQLASQQIDFAIFNTVLFGKVLDELESSTAFEFKLFWVVHEQDVENYGEFLLPMHNETSVINLVFCSYAVSKNFPIGSKFFSVAHGWYRDKIFTTNSDSEALARIRNFKEGDHILITLVGTICSRKRQLEFLKAYERFVLKFPKSRVKVLIVGTSEKDEKMEELTTFLESHLLGKVLVITGLLNVQVAYEESDLHWSNSVSEAFPLNILEATYKGVPIVSTDIPAVQEMLPRGSYAHYKQDDDVFNVLYHTLKHLDHLKTYSLKAYKHALAHYNSNKGITLWRQLLGGIRQEKAGEVCIIVRTFRGHQSHAFYKLSSMLQSVINLEYRQWHAWVVNTDSSHFPTLVNIVYGLSDARVNVLNLNLTQFNWGDSGYRITDQSIPYCKPNSQWLLVTNGDNYYYPSFLNHLDTHYDIIASDFYSRYTHVYDDDIYGVPSCERDSINLESHWCKRNILRLYHTDLGANILNYKKFKCQKLTFSGMMVQDSSQDSQMMETLVYYGWKVKHIYECLLSHNPNPVSCSLNSGVWDYTKQDCFTEDSAKKRGMIVKTCGVLKVLT